MNRVFFSYATEDRSRVIEFAPAFKAAGIEVLIDHSCIQLGGSVSGKINEMISNSDGAVLFYSAFYDRKPWTTEECDALIYRAINRGDYQVVVVCLDETKLPPLLEHRLWAEASNPGALASIFSAYPSKVVAAGVCREIGNWLQYFADADAERMALAIQIELRRRPDATEVRLRTKKAGEVVVHIAQPLVKRFLDSLNFVLRLQEKVNILRNELRDSLVVDNLGTSRGAFLLAEKARVDQIESFRQELRDTLDALVERVMAG